MSDIFLSKDFSTDEECILEALQQRLYDFKLMADDPRIGAEDRIEYGKRVNRIQRIITQMS